MCRYLLSVMHHGQTWKCSHEPAPAAAAVAVEDADDYVDDYSAHDDEVLMYERPAWQHSLLALQTTSPLSNQSNITLLEVANRHHTKQL